MRIDKLLANSTGLGRKEIKQYIRKGAVLCNGEIVKDSSVHVDENDDVITLNGKKITYQKYVYLMLNKPEGYISATYDKKFPVVTDLVPEEYTHYEVFPVGRLDIDTHGLLLLTNDGELAHKLLSPKNHVPKTYYVKSQNPVKDGDGEKFEAGIKLAEDFTTLPAKLQMISDDGKESLVTICEGKFHQVKRMFEAIDNEVVYLKRISMGNLRLDETLEEGECRPLDDEETKLIFEGLK